MKLLQHGMLAAALVSLSVLGACTSSTSSPRASQEGLAPAINASVSRSTINTGESVKLMARTQNLVGARAIQWTASPNVARISPNHDMHDQTALFSTDQPGTYVVTASADMGDGRVVSSSTTITVNGPTPRGTASEKP